MPKVKIFTGYGVEVVERPDPPKGKSNDGVKPA